MKKIENKHLCHLRNTQNIFNIIWREENLEFYVEQRRAFESKKLRTIELVSH